MKNYFHCPNIKAIGKHTQEKSSEPLRKRRKINREIVERGNNKIKYSYYRK